MALDITTLRRAQKHRIARQQEALEVAEQLADLDLQSEPEPPRMRQGADGHWRGKPRRELDGSIYPVEVRVAVYTGELSSPSGEAQISLRLGAWTAYLSSTPDQMREFAALLTEAADLLDMLQRLDCGADGGPAVRRYRCFIARTLQIAESGLREFVQLRAPDAERAARLALAVTGALAVVEVVRLEEPTK